MGIGIYLAVSKKNNASITIITLVFFVDLLKYLDWFLVCWPNFIYIPQNSLIIFLFIYKLKLFMFWEVLILDA